MASEANRTVLGLLPIARPETSGAIKFHKPGKLMRFSRQPVNLTLKAHKNVVHRDAGPESSVYASVSFLFPK